MEISSKGNWVKCWHKRRKQTNKNSRSHGVIRGSLSDYRNTVLFQLERSTLTCHRQATATWNSDQVYFATSLWKIRKPASGHRDKREMEKPSNGRNHQELLRRSAESSAEIQSQLAEKALDASSHSLVILSKKYTVLGCTNRRITQTHRATLNSTLSTCLGKRTLPRAGSSSTSRRCGSGRTPRAVTGYVLFSLWSGGKTERDEGGEGNCLCRDKPCRTSTRKGRGLLFCGFFVFFFPPALHQGWALDAGRSHQLYLFSTILEQE